MEKGKINWKGVLNKQKEEESWFMITRKIHLPKEKRTYFLPSRLIFNSNLNFTRMDFEQNSITRCGKTFFFFYNYYFVAKWTNLTRGAIFMWKWGCNPTRKLFLTGTVTEREWRKRKFRKNVMCLFKGHWVRLKKD